MKPINPPALGAASGFSHGMLAPSSGRLLFVAGQTAADADGRVADPDFVGQFESALAKSLVVLTAAGGQVAHVGRMTVYVTDIAVYRNSRKALGEVWRRHMGGHYPAMALVQVSGLADDGASVEIEMTAVVPDNDTGGSQ